MDEYKTRPFLAPSDAVIILDSQGRNTFALLHAGLPASCILLPEINLNTASYHLVLSTALSRGDASQQLRTLFCPAFARTGTKVGSKAGIHDLIMNGTLTKVTGITSIPCIYLDFTGGLPPNLQALIHVLKTNFGTRILGLTRGKRNTTTVDFPTDLNEIPGCVWNQRTVWCRFYRL